LGKVVEGKSPPLIEFQPWAGSLLLPPVDRVSKQRLNGSLTTREETTEKVNVPNPRKSVAFKSLSNFVETNGLIQFESELIESFGDYDVSVPSEVADADADDTVVADDPVVAVDAAVADVRVSASRCGTQFEVKTQLGRAHSGKMLSLSYNKNVLHVHLPIASITTAI